MNRTGALLVFALLLAPAPRAQAAAVYQQGSSRIQLVYPEEPKRIQAPLTPKVVTTVLRGLDAVRFLYEQEKYSEAIDSAYRLLWDSILQPEALYLLAASLRATGEGNSAAVYNTLFLRVLNTGPPTMAARLKTQRRIVEERLRSENRFFDQAKAAHRVSAAGKVFTSPAEVKDTWMTEVEGDLFGLGYLSCWRLVGGRKDRPKSWIHNRQGLLHWSGLKYMAEVDGRKGVLYEIARSGSSSARAPEPKSKDSGVRTGPSHPTRVIVHNPGKGRFLRIGVKAEEVPFQLEVLVERKALLSQTIGPDAWEDLKIDLGEEFGRYSVVLLYLTVPATERWSEGAWIDYIDFFDN
ncbi:MAG: hypothetical protein V1918_00295 [Planctomycetota bacterium]